MQAAGLLSGSTPGVTIQALVGGFQHAMAIAQVPPAAREVRLHGSRWVW